MRYDSRWKKWVIISAGILLLIVMGITMGGRSRITFVENIAGNVLAPIQRTVSVTGNFISEKVTPIFRFWTILDENETLREENAELKNLLTERTLDKKELNELRDLSKALDYNTHEDLKDYKSFNVIAKDSGNWFNMFVIDGGLTDGIQKNSAVISGDGLVGLVYEAGDNWAKVISIIDYNTSIGFELNRIENDFDGLITGSVQSVIKGHLFDPQAEVAVGDSIMTSGVGLYPKGIPIGEIVEVTVDRNSLLKEIVVEPSVDFRRLNKVLVLPAKIIATDEEARP